MSDPNNASNLFPDKINTMNYLLPRNLRRSVDALPVSSQTTNPLVPTLPPISNISALFPSDIQTHYLNLLAMNSPLLSPFLRQLTNTWNKTNTNREQVEPPHPPVPLKRSVPATSLANETPSTTTQPLPKQHEVEEVGEIVYSIVEGEKVMGFNVWGEVRLCLPHLLRFVLHDVDIDDIGQAISRLRISCTKCSPLQLATLHGCSALPSEVSSCGLIRKSDAERMLNYLRENRTRPSLNDVLKGLDCVDGKTESVCLETFIDVTHDCFGRQKGRVYPLLYKTTASECILCHGCGKLFSPTGFVGHHHGETEVENCIHWGFNSTNWRSYLHLDTEALNSRKNVKHESSEAEPCGSVAAYQMFEDFKLKFLKPLRLPKEILKMVGRLENRSISHQPLDCSVSSQKSIKTMVDPPKSNQEVQLGPYHKIRRLWAPHKGHFTFPEPPKLMANCSTGQLPNHLNTGTPNLLDPSCIVTKDSAHLYGRDFIPNVCLRPVNRPDDDQDGLHGLSKGLPSNEDISSSSASTTDLYSSTKSLTTPRTGRSALRRSATQLSNDFSLLRQTSQGLNSIDSSPARARHSSCGRDPLELFKRCGAAGTLEMMGRCPSVDSATAATTSVGYRLRQLQKRPSRTASNPELNTAAVSAITVVSIRPGFKRGRPGSRSVTPTVSPIRRKRYSETNISRDPLSSAVVSAATPSIRPTESRFQTTAPNTNPNRTLSVPHQASTLSGKSAKLTPEILLNLASESISRVPNLVDHWISTVERINQFCDAVAPKDDESARQRFESEKQNMLADLNVIRGKNMEQISTVFDQNQKLWKMAMDSLIASSAPPPLTPNTQAPPFGVIPGVNPGLDPLARMIQLLQTANSTETPSNGFRQSTAPPEVPLLSPPSSLSLCRPNLWLPAVNSPSFANLMSEFSGGGASGSSSRFQANDLPRPHHANPNIDFLPPYKRQRLLRHSTSATSGVGILGHHHLPHSHIQHRQAQTIAPASSSSSSSLRTDYSSPHFPGSSS